MIDDDSIISFQTELYFIMTHIQIETQIVVEKLAASLRKVKSRGLWVWFALFGVCMNKTFSMVLK